MDALNNPTQDDVLKQGDRNGLCVMTVDSFLSGNVRYSNVRFRHSKFCKNV